MNLLFRASLNIRDVSECDGVTSSQAEATEIEVSGMFAGEKCRPVTSPDPHGSAHRCAFRMCGVGLDGTYEGINAEVHSSDASLCLAPTNPCPCFDYQVIEDAVLEAIALLLVPPVRADQARPMDFDKGFD